MKLSYYPGCSIHASAREYEISATKVLKNLDIEFEEIGDWNCCGALETSSVNHLLSLSLPARNLAMVGQEHTKIIMLCSACQQVHNKVKGELKENPSAKKEVEDVIGKPINVNVEIEHLIHYIVRNIDIESIKSNVKVPLNGLKVLPYYGCLVNRPYRFIHGDDPNFPESQEKIFSALGIESFNSYYKTRCCGGTLLLPAEELSHSLTKNILEDAKKNNIDCISVVCPLCHTALETTALKLGYSIPIVYFTQLMGLAFGYTYKEVGLQRHLIPTAKLMNKLPKSL